MRETEIRRDWERQRYEETERDRNTKRLGETEIRRDWERQRYDRLRETEKQRDRHTKRLRIKKREIGLTHWYKISSKPRRSIPFLPGNRGSLPTRKLIRYKVMLYTSRPNVNKVRSNKSLLKYLAKSLVGFELNWPEQCQQNEILLDKIICGT